MCPSFSVCQKSFAEFAPVMAANKLNHFCRVGALRKYAGGIFLASDLGGYAAVASIWGCTARRKWAAGGRPRAMA